jgi:hypothetical protein
MGEKIFVTSFDFAHRIVTNDDDSVMIDDMGEYRLIMLLIQEY